jgi:tetratricopeptide (TPR) repeat protein
MNDNYPRQPFDDRPVQVNRAQSQQPNPPQSKRNRLESVAYIVFLATIILTLISFLPTPYVSLSFVKTIVIVLGTVISAICYGLIVRKEKSVTLPVKPIFWTGVLVVVSLIISALLSNHLSKALFGQGFEIGAVGFMLVLFISAFVAHESVRRDRNRALVVYGAVVAVFLVLVLLEASRLIFGPAFVSLSILTTVTSTVLGGWYDFGILSLVALIVLSCAIVILPLSGRAKLIYGIIAFIALLSAFTVNHAVAWIGAVVVFAILAISLAQPRSSNPEPIKWRSRIKHISWLPAILCVIAIVMVWKGGTLASPVIQGTNTQYAELSLPWQMTVDVATGAIKNYPWFGVGPNHFGQAFNVYKPAGFNTTDAWSVEFNAGFGLIPTFIVTQGSVGAILWILLFVFLGIASVRLFKRRPDDPQVKFLAASSAAAAIFLWVILILYVPSHAIVFLAFVMTGVFLAMLVEAKAAQAFVVSPVSQNGPRLVFSASIIVMVLVMFALGLVYAKKFVALSYFASGLKDINASQDFKVAGAAFNKALSFDSSDVYWQALAENNRLQANQIIASATSSSPETVAAVVNLINDGVKFARQAIAYDPTNYYNYVSEARISDVGASLKMTNAPENAVRAYTDAIRLNPLNPALYVSLAQSEAANGKLDDALQAVGAALQVKNNYLDAVYLLSQIQAAQGNLKDAIISTQVATQMNPQSSLLFFQLGLLNYNAKDYASAVKALEQAVKLTPNYANAQYFLGLSYVRLNRNPDAVAVFTDLAKTNPDNKEVSLILTNLRAGKSPFADAKPPVTPTPEKRATLPVKEKK